MKQRAGRKEAKESDAQTPPWTLLATGTIYNFTSNYMPSRLTSCSFLSGWQSGKSREKKGEFFIEENK